MSYEDVNGRITKLNEITSDALDMASSFMSRMAVYYGVGTIKPPTANVVLIDPLIKTLKPLVPPSFDSGSLVKLPTIYEMADGDNFRGVLSSPPAFQGVTTFSFTEEKVKWLIDDVKIAIQKLFNETGFEDVEIEIWNKGVEKRTQQLKDAVDNVLVTHSARGFTMPNDMMDRDIEAIDSKFDDDALSSNSEITLKQLDLAQKNAQSGIISAIDGEALLMGYFSRMANRALSAAKSAAGLVFDVFNAEVIALNAQIRANREHMRGAVEIELANIDAYEATLEAKKTEIEALSSNLSSIISSYQSLLQGYRSEIRAERSQASVVMSWRRAKYRENIAGIKTRLESAILEVQSWLSAMQVDSGVKTSSSGYYVNYLAAALGALQVMVNEETLLKNTESAS